MRRVPTSFQNAVVSDFQNDPAAMDRKVRQMLGVSADHMNRALIIMSEISQGRMPPSDQMAYLYATAKQQHGLTPARVQAELRQVIANATPEERISAYLSLNNKHPLNQNEYRIATALVPHALRADLQNGLEDKIEERRKLESKSSRNFEGMTASRNVREHSANQKDVRNLLDIQMGNVKPKTIQGRIAEVTKSRLMLADRIDASAMKHQEKGTEPSLRETLRDTYDVAKVSAESEDLGLGNPQDDALESISGDAAYMQPDFDVTENLD